jgi:hypothetical protein
MKLEVDAVQVRRSEGQSNGWLPILPDPTSTEFNVIHQQ